jgi:cytochrome P450
MHYPPGPPNTLNIGALLSFRRNRKNFIVNARDAHGDIAYAKLLGRDFYMLFNPEEIHRLLVREADKLQKSPIQKRNLGSLLGNGLLNNEGEDWRRQRKLAQPAFHMQRISSYADMMVDYTARTVDSWRELDEIEVHEAMMHLTMEIVAKALFDADVTDDADDISHAVTTAISIAERDIGRPVRARLMSIPFPGNRELASREAARETLDNTIFRFIEDRRALDEDRGDLLSMLMLATYEDGSHMSTQQFRDELITLFIAGHETTAVALTWALYLLAEHPAVYEKAVAVVDAVVGDGRATMDDLKQLAYIKMIVQEAMRLYPPAWIFARQVVETVEVQGYTLAPGSIIAISPYAIQRDPRYWEDPEAFIPERFETHDDNVKSGYLPFGGGPRVCIGNSFAMMEMTLVLTTLLQHFRFETAPDQSIEAVPVITLRPKDGVRLRLHQREVSSQPTDFLRGR